MKCQSFVSKKIFYHKPKFEVCMYRSRALRFKGSCADPESFFQRGSNFDNDFLLDKWNILTPGRRQSETLFTIDKRGSNIDKNSVFDCHLSPFERQMTIENCF